jgi:hypothetical protein
MFPLTASIGRRRRGVMALPFSCRGAKTVFVTTCAIARGGWEREMSEMIDRVALAIYRDNAYTGSSVDWTDEQWDEVDERICKQIARVAIAAMREPTEAMKAAGREHVFVCSDSWRAMIDASLFKLR